MFVMTFSRVGDRDFTEATLFTLLPFNTIDLANLSLENPSRDNNAQVTELIIRNIAQIRFNEN